MKGKGPEEREIRINRPVIYWRGDAGDPELMSLAKEFKIIRSLDEVEPGDLVICRFSYLPYAEELRQEILKRGGELIQSNEEYQYASNLRLWYQDLKELTLKPGLQGLRSTKPGPL